MRERAILISPSKWNSYAEQATTHTIMSGQAAWTRRRAAFS